MTDTVAATNQRTFQLRGSLFTLSVLQLIENNIEQTDLQLTELIAQAPKFFDHAPIVIDLQQLNDPNSEIDFKAILESIRQHNLIPVGVRGGTAKHHRSAKNAGLAILSSSKSEEPQLAGNKVKNMVPEEAHNKLITKPVRSGQQIYAKGGDLIVLASVSEGAELLADGNIHVYGTLRGRALAGINGNTNARIFCQCMQAELISIAGYYIVNEAILEETSESAQQVYLENGKLQITTIVTSR